MLVIRKPRAALKYVWIYENSAKEFESYHSYFTFISLLLEAAFKPVDIVETVETDVFGGEILARWQETTGLESAWSGARGVMGRHNLLAAHKASRGSKNTYKPYRSCRINTNFLLYSPKPRS